MKNTEFVAKWIEALKSGEYSQGFRSLVAEKDGVKHFCCLGVACDLLVKMGYCTWDSNNIYYPKQNQYMLYENQQHGGVPPKEVIEWLELAMVDSLYRTRIGILIAMNDTERLSFETIAKTLEKMYEDFPLNEREFPAEEVEEAEEVVGEEGEETND